MNIETLNRAVDLARRIGHILVATASADGTPHLAVAEKISRTRDNIVAAKAWFCPGTMSNVKDNPRVALVIWYPVADEGYQLLGEVQYTASMAIQDGYAPGVEGRPPLPQVEHELLVCVSKVVAFSRAPHSDVEPATTSEKQLDGK
jgi:hypothetical protein